MGIHYSEFDEMFKILKNDIPIPLSKALEKWERIKINNNSIQQEWIKLLEIKSIELMDEGYSVGTAMLKAWDESYAGALEDYERDGLGISVLRDSFFEDTLYMLETYEECLIEGDGYECCKCGWFTWDSRKDIGYCNNFCINRKSKKVRCISKVE